MGAIASECEHVRLYILQIIVKFNLALHVHSFFMYCLTFSRAYFEILSLLKTWEMRIPGCFRNTIYLQSKILKEMEEKYSEYTGFKNGWNKFHYHDILSAACSVMSPHSDMQ